MKRSAVPALVVVQVVLAYEWLSSGLTKVVDGGFPAGLANDLRPAEAAGAYGAFVRHVVVPHAFALGWAIQVGELAVAALFLLGALSRRLLPTALASFAGALLTVNFGLAAGDHFFSLVGADAFDEGVPLDVLATWLQVGLLAYVVAPYLRVAVPLPRLARARRAA